jgi:hypothetical protein
MANKKTAPIRKRYGRERMTGLRTGGSVRQSATEEIRKREAGQSQDGRQREAISYAASRLRGNTRDDYSSGAFGVEDSEEAVGRICSISILVSSVLRWIPSRLAASV